MDETKMSQQLATQEYLINKVVPYDKIYGAESIPKYISTKIKLVRAWFGGKCFHCGVIYDLEFAHVLPTGIKSKGRGQARRLYDILKHPASYMLLCDTCHKAYDGKEDPKKANLFGIDLQEFLKC